MFRVNSKDNISRIPCARNHSRVRLTGTTSYSSASDQLVGVSNAVELKGSFEYGGCGVRTTASQRLRTAASGCHDLAGKLDSERSPSTINSMAPVVPFYYPLARVRSGPLMQWLPTVPALRHNGIPVRGLEFVHVCNNRSHIILLRDSC